MRRTVRMKNQMTAKTNAPKIRSALKGLILLGIMICFNPVSALSADDPWEISVGAGAYTANVYYGADEYYVVPFPHAKATYTRGRFSASASLLDGIGAMYMDTDSRFFGSININGGEERDPEEYNALGMAKDHSDAIKRLLEGSPAVKTSVRTEIMAGYLSRLGNFGISLEYHPTTVEGDTDRSYDGFVAGLSYCKPFQVTEKLVVTGMLGLSVMDQDYAEAWFSVEAPTQRLEAFDAEAGLRDLHVVLQIDYMVSPRIGITLLNGNCLLLKDAGESPYTQSKYQMTSAVYGFYTF